MSKLPLGRSASNLAVILDAIDSGDINEALDKLYNDARLDIAGSVSQRICDIDHYKGELEQLEKTRDLYSAAISQMKNVISSLEKRTMQAMELIPGHPFKSETGSLQIKLNPAALSVLIPTKDVSVSNTILDADIHKWKIDQRYLVQRNFYCLSNETIKDDLKGGKELAWATLKQGRKLKINRNP